MNIETIDEPIAKKTRQQRINIDQSIIKKPIIHSPITPIESTKTKQMKINTVLQIPQRTIIYSPITPIESTESKRLKMNVIQMSDPYIANLVNFKPTSDDSDIRIVTFLGLAGFKYI